MKPCITKTMLQILFATALLSAVFTATVAAQQSSGGTINTLSVDPRQNAELTNSTGTESGQPNDVVRGSQNQENGLIPATTNMEGSGSNGNMNQTPTTTSGAAPKDSTSAETTGQKSSTREQPKSTTAGSSAKRTTTNPKK